MQALEILDVWIRKQEKTYFQPEEGEKPPKGTSVSRGPRGGMYYTSQPVTTSFPGLVQMLPLNNEEKITKVVNEFSLKVIRGMIDTDLNTTTKTIGSEVERLRSTGFSEGPGLMSNVKLNNLYYRLQAERKRRRIASGAYRVRTPFGKAVSSLQGKLTPNEEKQYRGISRKSAEERHRLFQAFIAARGLSPERVESLIEDGWISSGHEFAWYLAIGKLFNRNYSEVISTHDLQKRFSEAPGEDTEGLVSEIAKSAEALYAWTQNYLKSITKDPAITLYRGVKYEQGDAILNEYDSGVKKVNFGLRPLSSWASDSNEARIFASMGTKEGVMIRARVPTTRILYLRSSIGRGVRPAWVEQLEEVVVFSDINETLAIPRGDTIPVR